jgi:hypothetical protein
MTVAMKTTTLSLVISLIIILTASCKKESAGSASHKLNTYTEDVTAVGIGHVVETFNISYDEQDRITSVVSATKPGHRWEYQYLKEDKFSFDKIEDNKVTLHTSCFINTSLSKIDSTYEYNNRNDTVSMKYLYDSENRIVKQKEYIHSYLIPTPVWVNTINYQYDLKGTLTKKTDSYSEISYRYDTENENTVQIEPFFFPVQQKLPTHTYTTRWGTLTTIEHSYSFDDHKRLTSEKAVSSDGRVTVKSYTYQE